MVASGYFKESVGTQLSFDMCCAKKLKVRTEFSVSGKNTNSIEIPMYRVNLLPYPVTIHGPDHIRIHRNARHAPSYWCWLGVMTCAPNTSDLDEVALAYVVVLIIIYILPLLFIVTSYARRCNYKAIHKFRSQGLLCTFWLLHLLIVKSTGVGVGRKASFPDPNTPTSPKTLSCLHVTLSMTHNHCKNTLYTYIK